MSVDYADLLLDPRLTAPEPRFRTLEPGEESDYYADCAAWRSLDPRSAPPAPECPRCDWVYPHHQRGCWVGGDWGPYYRIHPEDFQGL